MLLRFISLPRWSWSAALLACALAPPARAEVRIDGTPAALQITAREVVVADVLAALATNLDVKYRSAIPLDRAANASYAGSLREVIARLLEGYNYVLRKEQERTEIVVFGRRGEAAVPPRPSRPIVPSVVSRWK